MKKILIKMWMENGFNLWIHDEKHTLSDAL